MQTPLDRPVDRFVDTLTPVLSKVQELAGMGGEPGQEVIVEASNLVAAMIDADGLHADEELWAYIAVFGPRLDSDLRHATPADVRRAGLLRGRAEWLERPSHLFEVLVLADRRTGSRDSARYYEEALRVAHVVASLDDHPSSRELSALERFRSMLRAALPDPRTTTALITEAEETVQAEQVPAALPPVRPLDELLAELDGLIGLGPVKEEVKLVTALIRVSRLREERGLPVLEGSRHLVFTGNPGTGKTTVARLLAEIYRTLGVVERGHLVETDRSGLVAGFVGQTALRVLEVVDRADQGVLLIDEAYALARGGSNDFGREAVDTLVKLVEDRRDRLVVIVAGYPEEMQAFLDANPGLRSRFPRTIQFPDYSDDELIAIVGHLAARHHYRLTTEASSRAHAWLAAQPRGKGFGNGRLARNLFEQAVGNQATRLVQIEAPDDDELITLTAADIPPLPGGPLPGGPLPGGPLPGGPLPGGPLPGGQGESG